MQTPKDENYGVVASLPELVGQRAAPHTVRVAPTGRVRTLNSGPYDSIFHGRGMEFDESRLYQAGDDVRTIDWRLMARTGRVHTKLFHEERERPVLMLVDSRPPMQFGTQDCFKSVLAARAAATLAWAVRDAGDRVGGIVLRPSARTEVAPQRSRARVVEFLRHISEATAETSNGPVLSLGEGLARLGRVARPGTLVPLLSDFHDLDEHAERELAHLARRCDVACIFVYDALEEQAPRSNNCRISDGQSVVRLPTENDAWRRDYAREFAKRRARLEKICAGRGAAFLTLRTGQNCQDRLRADRFVRAFVGARRSGAPE